MRHFFLFILIISSISIHSQTKLDSIVIVAKSRNVDSPGEYLRQQGIIFKNRGDFDAAEEVYSKALDFFINDNEIFCLLSYNFRLFNVLLIKFKM